jgi:hypothetical protein
MKLYSVECLSIDGNISFEKRDKIVAKFCNDDNAPRILIFSSIGSAGLNLSIACKILLFVSRRLRISSATRAEIYQTEGSNVELPERNTNPWPCSASRPKEPSYLHSSAGEQILGSPYE